MRNMINKYLNNLTKDQVNSFALSKNIFLNDEELDFTYNFIIKNHDEILNNPNLFDIDRYQGYYSPTTFEQIKKVYIEYLSKYQRFL